MNTVLSQVGSRELSRRGLKQSRLTVVRTEASHSWKGEEENTLQMIVQKYWSSSSHAMLI